MVLFYIPRPKKLPSTEPMAKPGGGAGGSCVPLQDTHEARHGVFIPGQGGAGRPFPAMEHPVERQRPK